MTYTLTACTGSTWQQKWTCGWHQPPSQAAVNAGYFTGHTILPWLIGIAIGLWIVMRLRRRRAATPAASHR